MDDAALSTAEDASTLTEAQTHFVAEVAGLLIRSGASPTTARLSALLVLAGDAGLTQQEICEQLGTSLGHVATSLKVLTGNGVVERVPVLGERRGRYRLPRDHWKRAIEGTLASTRTLMNIIDTYESATPDLAEDVQARLDGLKFVNERNIATWETVLAEDPRF